MIITGKGNYKGSASVSFTIKPKGTAISQVRGKSKGFFVKWKKQRVQTSGYQIQYATNKNFSKAQTVILKKNTMESTACKNLKARKKYYVRIRTYKTETGKKYYSDWSDSKAVTTKK